MKKTTTTILVCIIYSALFAQKNKVLIGIEGGPSYTYMYGNTILKKYHKPTVGYAGCLAFYYYFNSHFSVLTSLAYEKKGTFSQVDIPTGDQANPGYYKIHFNYNYLMMPVLFRYSFGKRIKYFINAGPMAGCLLFQQTKTRSNIMEIDDQYLTTSFKRWDFGISSGIGVVLPVTNRLLLSVELRNNTGLKSLNLYNIENNGKVKTLSNTFLVGISYCITNP